MEGVRHKPSLQIVVKLIKLSLTNFNNYNIVVQAKTSLCWGNLIKMCIVSSNDSKPTKLRITTISHIKSKLICATTISTQYFAICTNKYLYSNMTLLVWDNILIHLVFMLFLKKIPLMCNNWASFVNFMPFRTMQKKHI